MAEDINIIDIARFAGVSVSTVSRVLNNHPDVSPKTRQRVEGVIEQYAYVPNNSARNLKRESLRAIAVLVKGFTNPFFTPMIDVIQHELQDMRYMMLLQQLDQDQDELDVAISLVKEKKPRGVIFLGGNFDQPQDKMSMLGVPFVMTTISIQKSINPEIYSSVTIDDYTEAYKVVDHICKSGHKRIAAIGFYPNDRSISYLRMEGYKHALRDHGYEVNNELLTYAGDFSMSAGYNTAKRLLQKRSDFTCLFCVSDLIALGAIRAVYDAGFRIPEDISIVGFDGIEAGQYSIPSLATVQQPGDVMAHESVQVLMNRLRRHAPNKHLIFDAHFREGESFRRLENGDLCN